MTSLTSLLLPELIIVAVASALLMLGLSSKAAARRLAPWLAIGTLILVFAIQVYRVGLHESGDAAYRLTQQDDMGGMTAAGRDGPVFGTVRVFAFAQYIKLIVAGIGAILLLLAWPTNTDATGNSALTTGHDTSEFFSLALFSIAGVMLVAGANDLILLFLGIELASIPTYIMVSLSRPQSMAQEAGVKYFFLGAMSAALMLMGFAYLYGTTGGATNLHEIMLKLHPAVATATGQDARIALTPWQTLAVLLLVAGFAFKIAAVPLHFYAGDVYQGAATPLTAFLSFIPKTSGFVALIKLLAVLGGPAWALPWPLVKDNGMGLLWILAVLSMTVGNVLGLMQYNVKRVLAYSSIAHTGYMLVALAALAAGRHTSDPISGADAGLKGVLFYLAAYGIMNAGAFGVLMLLPARDGRGSAETFDDLAGQGKKHVALGLAMAVCMFSLIGIPLTVGFMGKLLVIKPALDAAGGASPAAASVKSAMIWLVIITMINAAVSAGYYLRILGSMFLRSEEEVLAPTPVPEVTPGLERGALPIALAIGLSVAGTLLFGAIPPATEILGTRAASAVKLESPVIAPTPAAPRLTQR